jgi:6-phosphogluconolactonase
VQHELVVHRTTEALVGDAARYVAGLARSAVVDHGHFTVAVSGGHTPWAMFAALAEHDIPWDGVEIFQVDERIAPEGDPDRNLTHLRQSLGQAPASVHAMAVTDVDLEAAADVYASCLPPRFDLVHLGLGPDGHTASLVPDDPVLDVDDRLVALTAPYQGRRRMTLTFPALARADQLIWLVTGPDKRAPLERLLACDRTIPAARVEAGASRVLADVAAAGPTRP